MRPLNRPMFKNGGPIKEGIMQGMKEPQMSNTVGSPLAPQDSSGRQKYAIQFAPLVFAAGRALARPFGQFVARQSRGGKLLGLKPVEKFKPNVFGKYLMDSPEGRLVTGGAGFAGKTGKTIFKGAKSLAKSPLTVGAGVYYGGGALLPDGTPDPNDPKNIKSGEGRQFTGDEAMVGDPRKPLPDSKPSPTINREAEIEANRKRYYELMGVDKMQKGAVYDTLIDASNQIREGGTIKDQLKSGNLVSSVINSLSKNLDKSVDLKKQIDAAILKGEITKDIEQSKIPDNIRTARMLGISDKEYKDKILGKGNLSEDLLAFANKQGSFPSGNQLAGFARNRGINITGVEDSEAVKDWMEANSSNEEGYIQSLVKEGKVPDGTYVINKRIFQVNGQDITSIV